MHPSTIDDDLERKVMLDLEALLERITEESPTGEDLRLSSTDASLTDLRRRLRELGPNHGGGSAADWQALGRQCEDVLRVRSKDLEVAGYLAIAWTQQHGFRGLGASLRLILGLCDRHWVDLHPGAPQKPFESRSSAPDSIDLDPRERALRVLSGTEILRAVAQSALLEVPGRDRPLTWEEYEFTQRVDELAGIPKFKAKYEELRAAGWVGSDEWREALHRAGPTAVTQASAQVRDCADALAELQAAIEKLWREGESPRFIPLASRLQEIQEQLGLRQHEEPGEESMESSDLVTSDPRAEAHGPVGAAPLPVGPLRNREDALRLLDLVGRYFRENEPHSPLSSICTRAVRWGRMPFEEVLREVLEDEKVLAKLWNAVGVREGPSS